MKNPLVTLFFSALVLFLSAWGLHETGPQFGSQLLIKAGPSPHFTSPELILAKYYFYTGNPEQAIAEMLRVQTDEQAAENAADFQKIIHLQQSLFGQVGFLILKLSASLPLQLNAVGLSLLIVMLIFMAGRIIRKRPLFAIAPFTALGVYSLNGVESGLVVERARHIRWVLNQLNQLHHSISDPLDIPSFGFEQDGVGIDSAALLETAFHVSTGLSDFPLARFLNTLKLWLDHPKYLLSGTFDSVDGKTTLKLQILDRDQNQLVKSWQHNVDEKNIESHQQTVDAILYPLLSFFNQGITTQSWKALNQLHVGLEEYWQFYENKKQPFYLISAIEKIETAIAYDPAYGLAYYNLGLVYLATGDYEKARKYFSDAVRLLKELNQQQQASFNYGVALYLLSQDWAYERAEKEFLQLLEQPKISTLLAQLTSSALAVTYAKMAGRSEAQAKALAEEAMMQADKVIANKAPRSALVNAWVAKGYAQLALNQFEAARTMFNEASKQDANHISNLIGLGLTEHKLGNVEAAIGHLQQAAQLSPFGGYAHYRIGMVYLNELQEKDMALQAFRNAGSLATAKLAAGKIYLEKEDYAEALTAFREATQLNSRLSDAWNNLAWAILKQTETQTVAEAGLMAEAEGAARRAIQLEKQEKQVWQRIAVLAECLLRQSKLEEALKQANLAVNTAPNQPQPQVVLGGIFAAMKQKAKAKAAFEKAVGLDKKGYWKELAEKQLKKLSAARGKNVQSA